MNELDELLYMIDDFVNAYVLYIALGSKIGEGVPTSFQGYNVDSLLTLGADSEIVKLISEGNKDPKILAYFNKIVERVQVYEENIVGRIFNFPVADLETLSSLLEKAAKSQELVAKSWSESKNELVDIIQKIGYENNASEVIKNGRLSNKLLVSVETALLKKEKYANIKSYVDGFISSKRVADSCIKSRNK